MLLPVDEYVERSSILRNYPSIAKNRVVLLERDKKTKSGLPWRILHTSRVGPAYRLKNFELRYFEPMGNSIGKSRIFEIADVKVLDFKEYTSLFETAEGLASKFTPCPTERYNVFLWEMFLYVAEGHLSEILNLTQLSDTLVSSNLEEREYNIDRCITDLSTRYRPLWEVWKCHFLPLKQGRISLKGWSANY